MSDTSEYWKDVKAHFRGRNKLRRFRAEPDFESIKELGLEVKDLNNGYQVRINGILDIFPTNMLYHDIKKNERGDYRNMIEFIKTFFNLTPRELK